MLNTIKKLQRELNKERYDETNVKLVVIDEAGNKYNIVRLSEFDLDTNPLVIQIERITDETGS